MSIKRAVFTDLLEDIIDNRGRTCPTAASGRPLIATNCVKSDALYPTYDTIRYVDEETYSTWFRGHPRPGDILFVCKGSPGNVALAPDPVDFCIAQDMVAVRADPLKIYPKYLFAVLRSKAIRQQIESMHVGTLIPHFKKGDFGKLKIPLMDEFEQKVIGDLYVVLSKKIESNRRIAENILKFADTLYEDALASGSTRVAVAEVAQFHNHERVPLSAHQRRGMPGKIPYYGATGVVDHVGQHLFDRVHVLVGEDGTVFAEEGVPITQYVWGRYWVNNHAHVLSGVGMSTEALLISLRRLDVRPGVTGAVQLKLSMGNLRSLTLMVPLQDDIHKIDIEYEPLFARYRIAKDETSTLTALRDSLLPELLSGRRRISEVAGFVESA